MDDVTTNSPGWSGPCIGGPMHGLDGSSRFDRGMLLVDRALGKIWIYDYVPWVESPTGGAFQVRIQEGVELVEDPQAPKNRWRAANETEFEIRVMP